MSPKPNKVLILHGWQADSKSNWFPEAKAFLEAKDLEVYTPNCPGNYYPKLDEWLEIIRSYNLDENWILIGHSLGGATILRYLEATDKPVGQVILAATPIAPMKFDPIANFFPKDYDWVKIRQNALKVNLIYEEGDQVVPLDHGQILAKKLSAPLEIIPGAIHLTKMDINVLDKTINE